MKPILRDFPDHIETERLLIRCPMPGDGAPLRQAVIESQEELKQWLPWAIDIHDEAGYEINIRNGHLRFLAREDLWFMLIHKESGAIIGGSGLHRINWDVPKFEIGYWLHTAYTRQGYITEAVAAIEAFAFDVLEAKRVEIRMDALNERSTAVARRLDYQLEGILRHEARHHLTNALRDTMIFAKIRD
ncbi:MAG: GNAT family N-acetyltransferase [Anaerolineales bacterium]|nr:GNAT family N-acetyltransferase [Anaerolineales bacterium]